MTRYQVVGECAHVTVPTTTGPMVTLLLRGALLPDEVTADRVKHLLSVNLIAPVDGGEPIIPVSGSDLNAPDGKDADSGAPDGAPSEGEAAQAPTQQPETDDENAAAEQRRAAARSKLPEDGSPPKGNASKAEWVEYAVLKGYDRVEVEKADRDGPDGIKALFQK